MTRPGAVLVTGASGFVGRAAIEGLQRAGRDVVAAVRQPVTGLPSGTSTRQIRSIEAMTLADWLPVLENIDCVVHLAAVAHIGEGVPESLYDAVNHRATAVLAEAARKAGVRRIVFLSSIRAITGPSAQDMLTDTSPAHPVDAYGRSKLAAENALQALGMEHVVLRPVVIVGAGVKGNIAAVVRAADTGLPWPYGALCGRRSLVSLDDVVRAIDFAIDTPALSWKRCILADAEPMTLAQMLRQLRSAMGRAERILSLPEACLRIPLRLIGRDDLWQRIGCDLVADAGGIRGLGFEFRYPVLEALRSLGRSRRKTGQTSE